MKPDTIIGYEHGLCGTEGIVVCMWLARYIIIRMVFRESSVV